MKSRSLVALLMSGLALAVLAPAHAQSFTEKDITFLDDEVPGEVDVRLELSFNGEWSAQSAARVVFCYADADNYLYLDISAGGLSLGEMRDGEVEAVATHEGLPSPSKPGTYQILIKRRSWEIRVVCDGAVVLRGYDSFAPGEKIGAAARGVKVEDIYCQPIGEMLFGDDFARPPGEPSPWETVAGNWKVSLPEARNNRAEAAKSANPFSFLASGKTALTLAGKEFWDGYEAEAAVKPVGDGYVGLAFYAQDKDDFYLFRVGAAMDPYNPKYPSAELVKLVGGKPQVVATATHCVESSRWYRLTARAHDGHLSALIDGKVVLEADDETFAGGRIGLYMQDCNRAYFDDVRLAPHREYHDGYEPGGKMPLRQLTGDWLLHQGRLCGRPDAQFGAAVGLTGSPEWTQYTFRTRVLPWSASSVGLYFGAIDPTNYLMFRWGPDHDNPGSEVQELWQIADGEGSLLTSRPSPMDRRRNYEIQTTLDREYAAVSVDGARVLEAVTLGRPSTGQVGYYVDGAAESVAAFDDLRVAFLDPPVEPVSITEQFAKEDTMADWARPLASWNAMGNRIYAYSLPAWGDFDVRFRLKYFVGRNGTISLVIGPDAESLADAPELVNISSAKDTKKLTCELAAGARGGAGGEVDVDGDSPLLELERRGGTLVVSLDGEPFAWTAAPGADAGAAVGLKLGGVGINLNDVTLTSPNIIDASFAGAPTDWKPQAGTWEVSDRWNCSPGWSWFCGRQAETPLLWSKTSYTGDVVFEFWAGMMMDMAKGPGYSHPSDINGIICGDGANLCSGYATVLAGDNNARGKIIRKGETVADSAKLRFSNPTTSGNLNDFHRHWFHCRTERIGGKVTFYVDGEKGLEYVDPDPLPGGRVGIWSHQNNGLMIARARVAYKQAE